MRSRRGTVLVGRNAPRQRSAAVTKAAKEPGLRVDSLRGGKLAHPYAEWLDGQWHDLARGVDFDCLPASVAGGIRAYAVKRDYRVEVYCRDDGVRVRGERVPWARPLPDGTEQ